MANDRLRLGFQVWGQYVTWSGDHGHRPRDRRARLRRAVEQRPLLPAGRRRRGGAGSPRRPGLRGLVDPVRLGGRDESGADGLPGIGSRVPESRAAGQDGHGAGPRDGGPGRPRPRRRLVRAGAPRVRVRVPARRDNGSTGWGKRPPSVAASSPGRPSPGKADGSPPSTRGTTRRRCKSGFLSPSAGAGRSARSGSSRSTRTSGTPTRTRPSRSAGGARSSTSTAAPSVATRRRSSGRRAFPHRVSDPRGRKPSRH